MKKCGSKIALSLIAALAMVFAFATCSIDDMVADSFENGECGATHEWNNGEIIKAATENDDGEKKFTCTKCGKTKTEAIPALGHSHTVASEWTFDEAHHWHDVSCGNESHKDKSAHEWDDGEITKAATENDDGEKKFTCAICGSTKTEAIPAFDHNHIVASEWTSDEEFHWHEASCEKEEHRTDKTAHEWNDGNVTTDPTCTAEGERTYACTTCGKTRTEPVAASGHAWNEGEITKYATEKDDGEKTFTCTKCNETRTEAVPALGHEHTVASEWTSDEEFHWHEASCGREAHRTDKTEHVWNTGEITTAPTCTTEGKRTYTCTTCGKTKTEAIATSGHANMTVSLLSYNGERQETCPTCGYKATSAWTKETLSDLSAALKNHGENYGGGYVKLNVVGALSDTKAIATALLESSNFSTSIDLNLSGTTGLTTISFKDCTNLVGVLLPSGVAEIGNNAFENCKTLYSITIPDSVIKIGNSAFSQCERLPDIIIPDSVTEIGEKAFSGCKKLTNITIPNGVTKIGFSTFRDCEKLAKIIIPNSVTEIRSCAFENCKSLTSITIPNGVTKIEWSTFQNCASLNDITIPDSVTEIEWAAFGGCESFTNIAIPNSVTEIGIAAFYRCKNLTNITIPNSVTKIGDQAFWYCNSLKSVVLPPKITEICDSTFANSGLKNIELPKELMKIATKAFENCESLENIKIPASVTLIGYKAFGGCYFLETVEFEDTSEWYVTNDDKESKVYTENPSQNAKELRNQGGESTYWIKK